MRAQAFPGEAVLIQSSPNLTSLRPCHQWTLQSKNGILYAWNVTRDRIRDQFAVSSLLQLS